MLTGIGSALLAASLVVAPAVASPGEAVPRVSADPISSAYNLWQYALTIKGSQLLSGMGLSVSGGTVQASAAAQAAWGAQARSIAGKAAATSATAANVGTVYGLVDESQLAKVAPIEGFPAIGSTSTPAIGNGGKPLTPKLPAFSVKGLTKVTPGGVAGATVALTGYAMRADIANGVLSWFGVDAHGAVCSDPTASGGFINFLTGQDCSDVYAPDPGFVPNTDAGTTPEGWFGPWPADFTGGGVNFYTVTGLGPSQVVAASMTHQIGPYTNGGNAGTVEYWCGTAGSTTLGSSSAAVVWSAGFGAVGQTRSQTFTCGAGQVLRAWVFVNSVTSSTYTVSQLVARGSLAGAWLAPGVVIAGVNPSQGSDPPRYLECDVTGSNGVHYVADTATFRESELGASGWPAPNCQALPTGVYATHIKITELGGGQSNVLQDEDSDPAYVQWQADNQTLGCGAAQDCILDLRTIADGYSCFGQGDGCNGWITDPNRDAKYACYYGQQQTDIRECYVYAQLFDTSKRLAGDPYADPATGEDPGQTVPSLDEKLMQRAEQDPSSQRSCGGDGDSTLNPIALVLRPVQCALEWAFVPRELVLEAVGQSVEARFDARAPGQIVSLVNGWVTALAGMHLSGCKIDIPFSAGFGLPAETVEVLNVCPGSQMEWLAITSRVLVTASVLVLVVVLIRRRVAAMVDFNA